MEPIALAALPTAAPEAAVSMQLVEQLGGNAERTEVRCQSLTAVHCSQFIETP